jgi:septal ring factor EnvC (AmiA/AmiB activator)
VAKRLTKIRADVGSTENSLAQLKIDFGKLKKEERSLEGVIARLGAEEQSLVGRGTELLRRKDELARDVRVAEQNVERQQALNRERLRVMYMNTSVSAGQFVLLARSRGDSERLAYYARSVRAYDDSRFRAVKQAVESLIAARGALERALDEGKSVQQKLQSKRAEVETQRSKLVGVMQQIKEKQEVAQRSLALLRGEASKLEELMRALTGGEAVDDAPEAVISPPERQPTQPVPTEEALPTRSGTVRRLQDVLHPEGLFGKTVRVVYPVRGDLLQRFGKTKVTDFSDIIFSKGLEYKTVEGSQVRAVLGGTVAFAGTMPGYDTVVIIDHGSRSYSLYGRLGKSFVQKGDVVGQKDPVGITSAPDAKGRNFYFETRKNGAPVDPTTVLSKAS